MNLKPLERHPKVHPPEPTTVASLGRSQMARRRSSRMALNASIGMSGEDRQKAAFTMNAKAGNLNRHGAAVQLNRELLVGSTVVVQNARGTRVSARIVAKLAALHGVPTYAIEFIDQDENARDFWGITFPSLEGKPGEQTGISRRRRNFPSLQG